MFRQMVSAGRLDRSFYTSIIHDSYATGNAVLVVAVVGLIPGLSSFSLAGAAFAAVSSIVQAAIVALGVWAAGVYLFRRYGRLPVSFRLVGFANVALIPVGIGPWLGIRLVQVLLTIASAVWFFAALRVAARSQFDLDHPEDSFVAGAGILAWYVAMILL